MLKRSREQEIWKWSGNKDLLTEPLLHSLSAQLQQLRNIQLRGKKLHYSLTAYSFIGNIVDLCKINLAKFHGQ